MKSADTSVVETTSESSGQEVSLPDSSTLTNDDGGSNTNTNTKSANTSVVETTSESSGQEV
eukprot:CAMPEP_0202453582 /NCGR_PEP_ID=MMETSP1360-20130828/11526_1 /ASSEMBLY_ACC=CAM_ASM_000848 /TAXON_ID=515479 /ORGANISM="Licmophora paradoxa, Strain CCMP2313" /LENGTH=60 /DNA_ID=CAMNT_0049072719 /DNA_START=11 /DNA_END=190 /DNA_ORIENTATION=+